MGRLGRKVCEVTKETTLRAGASIIPAMKHVVVVGGGVSGLATAYWVAQQAERRGAAIRTTVLESASRPGGRVWTERVDGFQIELGANGFLDSKRSTMGL